MTLKKHIKEIIRGWLPKAPDLSSFQQTKNQKTWSIQKRFAAFFIIGGFMGALFGALSSFIGLSGLVAYTYFIIIGTAIGIAVAAILIRMKQNEEQQRTAGKGENKNPKKYLENRIHGWLPKESNMAYVHKPSKPRWKIYWKTLSIVVVVIVLVGVAFVGVRTFMHYSNPALDVAPSPYYEKTTNSTTVGIGDILEVNVWVHWHGYVLPEFKRNVKIVDPFPELYFSLARENETNVYQMQGYGGSYHLKYSLRVDSGESSSAEFPAPRLYLDDVEIPLSGTSTTLKTASK